MRPPCTAARRAGRRRLAATRRSARRAPAGSARRSPRWRAPARRRRERGWLRSPLWWPPPGNAVRAGTPGSSSLPPSPWASRSAANRCCDISGLRPVPRIPKRRSTKNGNEAASRAAPATGRPMRTASRSPSVTSSQERQRGQEEHSDRHQSACSLAGQPHRAPGDRRDHAEPDRRREPRPLAPPADREYPLPDDERGSEDQ